LPAWLTGLAAQMKVGLLWPAHELIFVGSSRYFWVYCVTGLAMANYAHRRNSRPGQNPLLAREVWLSRSALNDYVVLLAGPLLRVTLLTWAFVNWQTIAHWVAGGLKALGVSGTVNGTGAIAAGVGLTVSLFLVDDFLRFYLHYLLHRVPELWEFHKVHHAAEVLNFATAERLHPAEVVFSSLGAAVGLGLVNGIFIALFGDTITVATLFGANALLVLFNLFGGVLRHSPVWISFGPRIERWIVSPAMHQVHHSRNPLHHTRNLGSSLSVWDRAFGTLHLPRRGEIEGLGIGEETPDFRSLSVLYLRPFLRSGALVKRRVNPNSRRVLGERLQS
jgi:sterol desaturase/sphingolipid hydroxylase (fatty acid hydroxylase superfamily)